MRYALLIALVVMAACEARTFSGSGTIKVIEPTDSILAVCAMNEKYVMEPGQTINIRLYIRNAMVNKTVGKIYLEIEPSPGFNFTYRPNHIENLTTVNGKEVTYFDIYATAAPGLNYGNYKVNLLVGTDEFMVGSYQDEVMIKVRPYSRELFYIYAALIIIIITAFIMRFSWIMYVNRKRPARERHRKKISVLYYKG